MAEGRQGQEEKEDRRKGGSEQEVEEEEEEEEGCTPSAPTPKKIRDIHKIIITLLYQ